ncbi:Os12g0106700, partial [Oryza sativa Japonica Group]
KLPASARSTSSSSVLSSSLSLRQGSRNPLPVAAVRLLLLNTTTPSEPQLIGGYLLFLGVMPLPATPAYGAVHLPRHTGVSMDTSAEAIFVGPSPPVTADIEESLSDYTSMMEGWTKEHVLAARGLRNKVAPIRVEAMRLGIAADSAGITCFLDAFDECMKRVDLHLVTQKNSFQEFLGSPLQQTVPDTCAIVSSTKCVEVQHRREYETMHGTGSFPCNAAAPRKLRRACFCQKVWKPKEGARVGDVIDMIQRLGGARTTSAPAPAPYMLPVRSWQRHRWDVGGGLTADRIAELLDTRGPFIGTIWVCPWYDLFNSVEDEDLVYRSGCARSKMLQRLSKFCFGKDLVGLHSVLCFEYRICDGQLHIHILDNHETTGPQRWIHHSELEEVHTITVERINHLGDRHIRYPHSGVS